MVTAGLTLAQLCADTSRRVNLATRADMSGRAKLVAENDMSGRVNLAARANTSRRVDLEPIHPTWPPKVIHLDGWTWPPRADTSGQFDLDPEPMSGRLD